MEHQYIGYTTGPGCLFGITSLAAGLAIWVAFAYTWPLTDLRLPAVAGALIATAGFITSFFVDRRLLRSRRPGPETEAERRRSLLGASIGVGLWWTAAFILCDRSVTAFAKFFADNKVSLPPAPAALVAIPHAGWIALAILAPILTLGKDSLLSPKWADRVNYALFYGSFPAAFLFAAVFTNSLPHVH